MGFPRIISKNNKVYTKLGDFCLSSDGNHFWILCFLCQEELQTQDHFWKHIQDEHNFFHSIKQQQEHRETALLDQDSAELLPIPLYRKLNEEEQRMVNAEHEDEDSIEQAEPKDYTEMRVIEPNAVEINIKVEPPNTAASLRPPPPPPPTAAQAQNVSTAIVGGNTNIASGLYHLPHLASAPAAVTYNTVVHHSTSSNTLPTLNLPVAQQQQQQQHSPVPASSTAVAATLLQQHELKKDSNSTTASASSAVSSEDGERWYVCDYVTCGLKFKYLSRLELHRAVHSKERRFACELCGASFKQSCNLSTHRKKKHSLKGKVVRISQIQQTF